MATPVLTLVNDVVPSGTANLHGVGFPKNTSIQITYSGTTYTATFRSWDDGTFDIGVVMPSKAGNYTVKASVSSKVVAQINVAVITPTQPVAFTVSIKPGAALVGTVQWVATVTTGTPKYFEFVVDGKLLWNEQFAPWGGSFDTTIYKNGSHNLAVTAFDNMSKPLSSQSVNVTFNNPTPPAPTLTATASDKKVDLGWH